MIIFYQGSNN